MDVDDLRKDREFVLMCCSIVPLSQLPGWLHG